MSFKNILISCILLGLFSFALISFAFQSQEDNGINQLANDPTFNDTYFALNSSLSSSAIKSNTQLNATSQDEVSVGLGEIFFYSIVGVGRTFTGTITGTYQIISTILVEQFNISPIILTTVLTIIIITIIFLLWKNIKTGD